MSLLKLKSLWYPIGTSVQESQRTKNSLQDYFNSLYSEQRQFTETLLSLFIRCSVPGVVLIVSIPGICLLSYFFLLTQVPTHKKYSILSYPLRSNSGWLPIRCAYFIFSDIGY